MQRERWQQQRRRYRSARGVWLLLARGVGGMGNDVHGEWAAFALDGQIGWRIGIGIVLKASFCALFNRRPSDPLAGP